jgi:hypothetical protein
VGSPFAAELDRRLAGDEPLVRIILWWRTEYYAWRDSQPSSGEGCPTLWELTENETVVLTLIIGWSSVGWPLSTAGEKDEEDLTKAINSPDVYPEVQSAWDYMQQARTALRAAQTGEQAQA